MAFLTAARVEYADAALRSGTRARHETLVFTFEVWVLASFAVSEADAARARCEGYAETLGDLLADDVTLTVDGAPTVQWAEMTSVEFETVPFETGWGVAATVTVTAKARI